MKPTNAARTLVTTGEMSRASFGIDTKDQAHILSILRDRLYTNKILAVLREYSSNAWDAHIEVDKASTPIKVSLPTQLEPSLLIKDWGPGLSEDDVYGVYARYGASTKRDSNKAVGMLGIGAKSAFAYNDSFSITSYHGGSRKVFVAVLDETDVGVIQKLHESFPGKFLNGFREWEGRELDPNLEADKYYGLEELDIEGESEEDLKLREETFYEWLEVTISDGVEVETGVEIKVPSKPSDVKRFQEEAAVLFPFFRPQPTINFPLTDVFETLMPSGFFMKDSIVGLSQWVAVMGCVPYRLNLDFLRNEKFYTLFTRLKGGLFFDIGEVDISANREELEYTDKTKKAVIAKAQKIAGEAGSQYDGIVNDPALSEWQKRLKVRSFSKGTGIPVPKKYKKYGREAVPLWKGEVLLDAAGKPLLGPNKKPLTDAPKTFSLYRRHSPYYYGSRRKITTKATKTVDILTGTRFVFHDSKKLITGYLSDNDRCLHPIGNATLDQIKAELQPILKDKGLTGIPILKTSEMTYTPLTSRSSGPSNPKHQARCFEFSPPGSNGYLYSPYSKYWSLSPNEPQGPDDVFVILERFEIHHPEHSSFYGRFFRDRDALKGLFDEDMPTVFGIKTTERKPVYWKEVAGTDYFTWITGKFTDLLKGDTRILELWEAQQWWYLGPSIPGTSAQKMEQAMREHLDGRHRLVRLYKRMHEAHLVMNRMTEDHKRWLDHVRSYTDVALPKTSAAKRAMDLIFEKYPLLQRTTGNGLQNLHIEERREHWLHYVKLVDKENRE